MEGYRRRVEETNVKLARTCYKRILPQTADNKSQRGMTCETKQKL